jgi:hypothetical protein
VFLSYLVDGVEVVFHALDSDVLAGFYRLGFQNLTEGSLAFLADQPVL